MGYTNRRDTMKWLGPHTKKLKPCSSAKYDEQKINLAKDVHQVLKLLLAQIFPPFQH